MIETDRAIVREAGEDDLPAILTLLFQLASGSRHPEASVRAVDARHRATLQRLLNAPDYHLLVLDVDGAIQGTCTLFLLPDLAYGAAPSAILEHVVIDEAARGSGFGQLLLGEAVRIAREAGCYKLSLTSGLQREQAHRFYEMIGFQNRSKGFSVYFM